MLAADLSRTTVAAIAVVAALGLLASGACATRLGRLTRDVVRPLDRSGDAAAAGYLSELLDRAHRMRLSERVEWRRLGHWRDTLTGIESQADGQNFFLSPHGATSPGAELDATLRGFFATLADGETDADVQHPICQFPARYRWLDRMLGFDPARLHRPACPRYDEFYQRVDADRLSFVFSSYYLNNPASVFGHTFVRIIKHSNTRDEERRELLDYAIEFSATVDTSNALIYGVKGLLGLFPGTFRNIPYHVKVRQYNDTESRDLYEYELDFTREEIDTFLEHLWELGSTYFDYYYVSENCSYHLLGALEAARPSLDLLSHMHWPVIPADTIKALYANPGLVREVRFRPSLRRQFLARLRGLDGDQRALVERLGYDPTVPLPVGMPSQRAIAVLDAAQDLVDIQHAKELTFETDTAPARMKQRLLERRAEIAVPSEPLSVATPWSSMPQLGHDSRRVGLGMSADDTGALGVALDARLALHDLADPAPGYPEYSQLEFLPTRARVRLDEDVTGRRRFELDSISLVRIVSLSAQNRFDRKLSWKVDAGMIRVADAGCSGYCYLGQLAMGTGLTLATSDARVMTFATLDVHLAAGPALDGIAGSPIRAGLGPAGGLRLRLAPRLISLTTGELIWLPTQAPRATWLARSILRLGLATNIALDLEGQLDNRAATAGLMTMLYF
ncbi:MAG: DUF4105 domain-containing protein [Deltaproteobacteria bacterium]|nr:MAG: DUF4105 domain-containing protein [Deltaproteobacteria bacterium]